MLRLASTSVLITGGAGFIGSALARRLVDFGYDVAVMDVLHPQVHGDHAAINLPSSVQLFTGDVTHAADWDAVLRLFRPSQIVHLAAETGTAQSLSEATRHGSVNVVGTTQLLDGLSRAAHVPDQIVLASSRAVYGEGAWQYGSQIFYPPPRSHAQLLAGNWDPQGPTDDSAVPLPSSASRTEPRPTNIYAATKLAQEHILAAWTAAHDTNLSVLRLQNVYGPGQSLTNSYTGIVALFARLAREQRTLEVYEDGRIVRDFVYIDDVVEALFAAIDDLRRSRAVSTSGRVSRQPSTSWLERSPPSVMPRNRSSWRNSATVTCAPQDATSSRQQRNSTGGQSGRSAEVCAICWTGSATSPNHPPSQAIT